LTDTKNLTFEWNVDNQETFTSSRISYFFDKGSHIIRVKVEDQFGNLKYDKVKLDINFWSLRNNWFWWLIYLIVILIVLYYWIVKIYYLFNRRKISRKVRYFLDVLDEHGWVERAIEQHLKNKELEQKRLSLKNKVK
jgi:hypothetical protein